MAGGPDELTTRFNFISWMMVPLVLTCDSETSWYALALQVLLYHSVQFTVRQLFKAEKICLLFNLTIVNQITLCRMS